VERDAGLETILVYCVGPERMPMAQLVQAAEGRGSVMMARIAILKALAQGKPTPPKPRRKRAKVFKLIR
jgi:hypothetical protein